MNLTAFRYFIKVAQLMSFTKAAEELYISQQSVSMQIKRLETEYHVRLFERKPSLKLTPVGETFLLFAKEIVSADEILIDQINAFHYDFYGTITIGLPANRTQAFAREFVPRFSERFPHMSVSLYEKPTASLLEAVQQNEVDLAVIFSAVNDRPDPLTLRYKILTLEPLYVVVADNLLRRYLPERFPACKETFREGITIESLRDFPLIVRPSSSSIHRRIVEDLRNKGCQPNILVQSATTSSMIPLCVRGYGVIFCTPMLLRMLQEEYDRQMNSLNLFPVIGYEHVHQASIVWHKNKFCSTPIQESMSIIEDIFQQKWEPAV